MNKGITELDWLNEIANIGMSRAATQLSLLLNDAVNVGVPEVFHVGPDQVCDILEMDQDEEIACVWQQLDGGMVGKALLLFHTEESKALISALVGSVPTLTGLDMRQYEHEAMTEIGNIIISSGACAIADMLESEVTLSVPEYVEDTFQQLIEHHLGEMESSAKRILIFKATLSAAKREVSGDLVILLGISSFDHLLEKIREYAESHAVTPKC